DPAGFEWIDGSDADNSVIAFLRKGKSPGEPLLAILSFTPVPLHNYRVGVPSAGFWREILNSDAEEYGGSGRGNMGGIESAEIPTHGRPHSLSLTLPPLGMIFLQREAVEEEKDEKDPKDSNDEVEGDLEDAAGW
ncbi:MAG TPA: alpha amylase C-terminal domain-containing protein, partial [Thermoanaerobaculia bacterium]|nr:alpha amylase C-terminal domain-containing protein [Thermoanaerobaculia bacterium]